MLMVAGSRGRRPRLGPAGSSSYLTRSKIELAIVSFLVGLVVLRGLLLLSGTPLSDLIQSEDEGLSPRHAGTSHHASSKGRSSGAGKGGSLGRHKTGKSGVEGRHGKGAGTAGAQPKLFSDMSETDLSGGEASRLRGGLQGSEHAGQQLIIGAVEHASSLNSPVKRGKHGSSSKAAAREPEREQEVVALLAEDQGFDPEQDETELGAESGAGADNASADAGWGEEGKVYEDGEEDTDPDGGGAAVTLSPEAAKRAQQRTERNEARRARASARAEARKDRIEERLSKLEELRLEREREVQEEKELLGKDLFSNLERVENKNARLSREQMPGFLPGQSQIGKAERAQLVDGKARRDAVKGMRQEPRGRRPLAPTLSGQR